MKTLVLLVMYALLTMLLGWKGFFLVALADIVLAVISAVARHRNEPRAYVQLLLPRR